MLAVLIVLFIGAVPAAARGADPTPTSPQVATDPVAQAIAFRNGFGLRSDTAFVREVLDSPAGRANATRWGTAVTEAEARDLSERVAMQNRLAPIRAYAEREAQNSYAGMFIDQRAGGLLRVAFTRDAAKHRDRLSRLFAYPARLRVSSATHTLAELERVQDEISDAIPRLAADGIDVRTVGQTIAENIVTVGAASAVSAAAQALRERYGSAVRVVSAPRLDLVSRGNSYPPLKGGLTIDSAQGLTSYRCTSAFVAQTAAAYYLLTAGHCGPVSSFWTHFVFIVGRMTGNSFVDGSAADSAAIQIAETDRSNLVFITDDNMRAITATNTIDAVGSFICMSANTSGYVCGSITSTSETISYGDGTTLRFQRLASFGSLPGDSGGPIFSVSEAQGVISGNAAFSDGTNNAIYSHIGHVTSALGVQVRTCCG